jgi:hypothetical protein
MSDGSYTTQFDVATLSAAQRQHLDGRLRREGIHATWAGDRLSFDQAFEHRVETLVADVRATTGGSPSGPPPGTATPSGPPPSGQAPPGYAAPPPYAAAPSQYPPAPYQAAPYPAPGYGGFYPTAVTNSNAIFALVLGICSWAVCGLCCIPAIILGRRAEREIEESGGTQTGAGLAKAGWIIGAVYAAFVGLAIVIVIIALIVAAATGPSTR